MASSNEILLSLKLLVDTKSNKVLFAEADHEFAGFLFGLLTLPIGAVSKFCSTYAMYGSVSRIYDSVDNIGDSYLQAAAQHRQVQPPGSRHDGSV
jgi:hypothetical protein